MIEPDSWQARCDWPGCLSVSHVANRNDLPETWLRFPGGLQFGQGMYLTHLCATHGRFPLARLNELGLA